MVEPSPSYWEHYFNMAFQKVKAKFGEIYPGEEAGELPPGIVGLKDFVYSLPCPVKILELRVDTERYKHIQDKICQLIGYDFSRLGDRSVVYCGVIDSDDTNGFNKFLAEEFGLPPSEELARSFCCDLTTTYFSDTDKPDTHFQFPRYDIRHNPEQYVDDLLQLMSWVQLSPETTQKFWQKEVDYNTFCTAFQRTRFFQCRRSSKRTPHSGRLSNYLMGKLPVLRLKTCKRIFLTFS